MQNKYLIGGVVGLVVIIAVAVGAMRLADNSQQPSTSGVTAMVENTPTKGEETGMTKTEVSESTPATSEGAMQSDVITVEGANFSFSPNTITVKKGQKVKILFKNVEGFHDFVIDEFNVKTPQIQANMEGTVEFTPMEVGKFEYYCSVGKHRQMGMVGTLVVEE